MAGAGWRPVQLKKRDGKCLICTLKYKGANRLPWQRLLSCELLAIAAAGVY
jgi:hypothetical protein